MYDGTKWGRIKRFFKELFCKHKWSYIKIYRSEFGELHYKTCGKCDKTREVRLIYYPVIGLGDRK